MLALKLLSLAKNNLCALNLKVCGSQAISQQRN